MYRVRFIQAYYLILYRKRLKFKIVSNFTVDIPLDVPTTISAFYP